MKLAEINKIIVQQIKKQLKLLNNAKFISTPKKNNVISYSIKSEFGTTLIDVYYIIIDNIDVKIVKIVDLINGSEEVWRDGTVYKIMKDMKGWYYSYNEFTFENTCILAEFKDHHIRIDKKYYDSYVYITSKVVAELILKHYYKLYNKN